MTEAIDHEVPAGAIAAALAMIEALHDRDPGQSDDDLQDVVRAELDRWGRETLTEAFMMLIGVGISLIQTPKDEPHVKYRIIGAVVSNFHQKQLKEVPDFMLPTVAGALTAAVLDQDPYMWRSQFGPLPADETLTWCYTAWMVVGMLDDYMGAGFFAKAMATILNGDPEESDLE